MEENMRLRCLELALSEVAPAIAHCRPYSAADVIERADAYANFVIRGEKPKAVRITLPKKRRR